MKSIKELQGNLIDYKLIESFQFEEGTFSFDELKSLVGKKDFARFLMTFLVENGVKPNITVKNGVEIYSPFKTSDNRILKFWCDSEGQLVDVSIFQPKSLF